MKRTEDFPDWRRLAPHRPLPPGSGEYLSPPSRIGDHIAEWVDAGGSTILLGGPAGVGKSTELAHATTQLQQAGRLPCLVQVDRVLNMRRATEQSVLAALNVAVAKAALEVWPIELPTELASHLRNLSLGLGRGPEPAPSAVRNHHSTLLLNELDRVTDSTICLVFDGLEKLSNSPESAEIFDALGALPESIALVSAIPWHAAFGPREQLIRPGEHFISMAPVPTHSDDGVRFFDRLLALRLGAVVPPPEPHCVHALTGAPDDINDLIHRAILSSGGLPRVFLQLLADAATYAKLRRGERWPAIEDLETAEEEVTESMLRALLPKDRQWLTEADLVDTIDFDPAAKVRLMAHGLLLEDRSGERPLVRPHPLLSRRLHLPIAHA